MPLTDGLSQLSSSVSTVCWRSASNAASMLCCGSACPCRRSISICTVGSLLFLLHGNRGNLNSSVIDETRRLDRRARRLRVRHEFPVHLRSEEHTSELQSP